MAESCNKAFGRYLKTLRDRRGLSLDDVRSLSQTFPETINKGYLSRCENGHQRLAFSKAIPLSRILEVPADVLLERMELDLELDRLGGPKTENKSYEELTLAGRGAMERGLRWDAYAFLRDAVAVAKIGPVRPNFRDHQEQHAIAQMSCASGGIALGRPKYALHECDYVLSTSAVGRRLKPIVLERLSQCYRSLGNTDRARDLAEQAVRLAEEDDDSYVLGYAYSNRAIQATRDKDPNLALGFEQKAFKNFKKAGLIPESARALNNLAQSYFDLNRYRAARSAIYAAQRIMAPLNQDRSLALGKILLGEIEALEDRTRAAEKHWRDAVAIAKNLNDRTLRFKAEFQLYKLASDEGNQPVARAIQRRLLKLSPWLPADTPELSEFKHMG